MNEEIELAAKTSGAIVAALAQESGVLGPVKVFADYISQRIGFYLAPKLAARAQEAAKKIEESGLPRRAFAELDEPLLTAILEGMAEETDPNLHDAWENLLANSLVEGGADVRRSFPHILQELEPADAARLNGLAPADRPETDPTPIGSCLNDYPAGIEGLYNLDRLSLVRLTRTMPTTLDSIDDGLATTSGVTLTPLGKAFVDACSPPHGPGRAD